MACMAKIRRKNALTHLLRPSEQKISINWRGVKIQTGQMGGRVGREEGGVTNKSQTVINT